MADKTLFLLRHAKSSWDDPSLADRDRPLAPRGRRAGSVIREHMEAEGIEPGLVLCSPSRRTRETLDLITPALGDARVVFEDDLYSASGGELLLRLREIDDAVPTAMLIGHNPGIQELALMVAWDGPDLYRIEGKFPTAALATLEVPGSWRGLAPGAAELLSFVTPKRLAGKA